MPKKIQNQGTITPAKRPESIGELEILLNKIPQKTRTLADMTSKEIIRAIRPTIEKLKSEKNLNDEEILAYITELTGKKMSLNTFRSYLQSAGPGRGKKQPRAATPAKSTAPAEPTDNIEPPKHRKQIRERSARQGAGKTAPAATRKTNKGQPAARPAKSAEPFE